MATDEGVRDLYLRQLTKEIEQRRSKLEPLRERKKLVQLEDAAQTALTPEQTTLLINASLIDKEDLTAIQADIDRLRAEIDAIQALKEAARQVP